MQLQEAYNLAVSKRKELQEELDSLKALNDSSLVIQKEEQLEGQDQKIAVLDNLRKKIIAKDKLSAFEMSDIVQLFQKKKSFALKLLRQGRVGFAVPADYRKESRTFEVVCAIIDKIKADYDLNHLEIPRNGR